LVRPLAGGSLALVLAALLAVSRWHITFSRIAFETILDPLATVLLLTCLLRALRGGRARDWALTGGALAFGLNGYLAFRAAAVAAVVFLAIELARRRRRDDVRGVGLALGGLFVTIAPLAVYAFQNPGAFTRRTRVLSVWNDVREAGGSLRPLLDNVLKTLGCLHLRGDESPINNLPGAPLLDPVTGAVVLLGLAWALLFLRDPVARLVLLWTGAVGSLDVLSNVSEAPSARRILGLLPVLLLAGGMALREIHGRSPLRVRRALAAMLGGGLAFAAWFNLDRYFVRQANHPAVWGAFSVDASAPAGELLRTLPASTAFYFSPIEPIDEVVDFIGGRRPYARLNIAATFPPANDAVYAARDCTLAGEMARLCPAVRLETHRDPQGEPVLCSVWADARTRASCAPELLRNGLVGRYYRGIDPGGATAAVQRDPLLYANDLLPAPFGIVWHGALAAPVDGTYRFRMEADDGALLLLDGELVVDNGGDHAFESRGGEVVLKRGFHAIELRYWQKRGARHLSVSWQPPGRVETLIPPRFLLPMEAPIPSTWPVPALDGSDCC
ncbi:MAG: PA14 domain-containing protein, partial [Thermoanaerobaculaceae bacterium]|nr:PA14 domain-containing protein [Thermoanaerobaculaceae bacterium]